MENTRIGPFLIFENLGRGRRNRVHRAVHEETKREVAIKFISIPPDVDRQVAIEKIHREAEILKKLKHPGLVQVFGAGAEKDKIFFAYELVKGEALGEFLARRGRLATDQAVDFAKQIAAVLEYIHQHEIIHGKLTPDKIVLDADYQLKVADLRLNRSKRRRWDSARKHTLETAAYLAPELFTGQGPTVKTDFYSLGVILYEMLTGQMPFEPQNMARLAKQKMTQQPPPVSETLLDCPFWLDKVVSQLMQPQPKLRTHSAKAVTLALDQLQKIDQTKQSAAEQVTAGFTALNAGLDKSEARRALGQKIKKKKKNDGMPFYKGTAFLVVALMVLFTIFAFTMIPPSNQKLMGRAKALMESDSPGDWFRARANFEKVMERTSDQELAVEAEKLFFVSKRRTLVNRMKRGLVGLENHSVRRFHDGFTKERHKKFPEALEVYELLLVDLDAEGKNRHVYEETAERVANIKSYLESEKIRIDDLRSRFSEDMAQAEKFAANGDDDLVEGIFSKWHERFQNEDRLSLPDEFRILEEKMGIEFKQPVDNQDDSQNDSQDD